MTTGRQLKKRGNTASIGISMTNYALVCGLANNTGQTCVDIIDEAVKRYVNALFNPTK